MDTIDFNPLILSVTKGKVKDVQRICEEMLAEKTDAYKILNEGLLAAMQIVAQRWKDGTVFIPEVLIAARALNAGLAILEPQLVLQTNKPKGKVILGTVKDDLHDIGKNIVGLMLKSNGFECIDLGVDVAPAKFVEAIQSTGANIVCMSALLTTSMIHFKEVVEAITEAGLRDQVTICVGGAPVTQTFATQIGADLFDHDAVTFAQQLQARLA